MPEAFHHLQTQTEGIHTPYNWVVADETARLALSVTSDDLYKKCFQTDVNKEYILTATTPTWIESGGSGAGYPFTIISVDLTSPHADYDDLATAMAAAIGGDVIVLGPGTHTITSKLTVTSGVGIIGHGIDITTIACTSDLGGDEMIEIEASSFLLNLSLSWTNNSSSATGVTLSGADSFIQNIDAVFTFAGSGGQEYTGIFMGANSEVINTDVAVVVTGGATNAVAIYMGASTGGAQLRGGNLDASGSSADSDLTIESFGGYNIVFGPVLNNGAFNFGGGPTEVVDSAGWYFDGDAGNIVYVKHDESFIVVVGSDETANISTGTAKHTFRMPYRFYLAEIRASVRTAPTGSGITIDVNEGGSTILSTKLTIDATEKTSTTAATPAVISDAYLADDAEITIDFDVVGSSTPGQGVKLVFIGYRF